MGNQNSRSHPQSPTNVTWSRGSSSAQPEPHPHPHQHQQHFPHHGGSPPPHTARRRESIQALGIVKAQAAPPSASLENAESHQSATRPHSRRRSQTLAPTFTSQLLAAQDSFRPLSADMGNEQSTPKAPSKDQILPVRPFAPLPLHPVSSQSEKAAQQQAHRAAHPSSSTPLPQTAPVNVPVAPPGPRDPPVADIVTASSEYDVPSQFSRPPRLPLPIEEELHTPGSPIISPQDFTNPLGHGEAEGSVPQRSSMLSTATVDDDDLGEEFKAPASGRPTVPTVVEWEGPGERVYVTGTFAGWNKKYKLHNNGPSKKKGVISAYVPIAPGTHHLMFIVDNDMKTSDKLPTAVDYTNILVNYLEVSADDLPPPATPADSKHAPGSTKPTQPREIAPGAGPPQVLPPTPAIQPIKAPLPEPAKPKSPEPTKRYHQFIPRYLVDLDAPEESSRFARANAMTNNLPTPPTLPGFLGKSILNGTTPMKDDSSVLIHPNHTVLNHLATSSIKDNILATSATTRYKQKFLTTIMYKPKEESVEAY